MLLGLERFQLRMDAEITRFGATFLSGATQAFQTWHKPAGCNFIAITCVGPGGNGGSGAVGAVSTAAGGGGGGGGAQQSALFPAYRLPEELFLLVGVGGSGQPSRVSTTPEISINPNVMMLAGGGSAGGNAAGATAGASGGAGTGGTSTTNPLLQQFCLGMQSSGGGAGVIGGTTVAGAALAYPVGGNTMGGTGGGGLPASGVGTNGGGITSAATTGPWIGQTGGLGAQATTTPGGKGINGYQVQPKLEYFTGGLGGGSSHATATGAGLFGGNGGDGMMGTGAGGGGGSLTGGTAGVGGKGGDGYIIIAAF